MPIFSIGFVVYGNPRRPVISVCGTYVDRWEVEGYWPRDDGMNCGCSDACIKPGSICAPQGDDVMVIFSIYDTDGDEFDLTGATEIVFLVADERGGTVRFTKSLSDGDISISTNGYQFSVVVTDDDTVLPVLRRNYYEVQVTNSAGLKKTVSSGSYIATRTMIKDFV